ncbi:MAG: UDP-N-acetylmuramoyl-L-alanine--D-glutamate ligase [Planctomycetota bacterium]
MPGWIWQKQCSKRTDGNMNCRFFKDKKVLIMGLGSFGGGLDAAMFAHQAGAELIITDLAPQKDLEESLAALQKFDRITYRFGKHDPADFIRADVIIVNPAVSPDNPFLKIAAEHNRLITSQIEIFFQLCKAAIIGITGANGKSTTTALTAHLLKAGLRQPHFRFRKVFLGGNIGNLPLLTNLEQIGENDLVVLELSSFQLEQLSRIQKAPHVALITNLTPNHLDRHGTFEQYCSVKKNIFRYQPLDESNPAVSIFNRKDPLVMQWFDEYKNNPGRVALVFNGDSIPTNLSGNFTLPGRANLENLAAALTIARHFGIEDAFIEQALADFEPLPHRLELIATINGVRWYNDSIATTPVSAVVALEAFENPKIIIAGGYDKHLPLDELGEKIALNAKAALLIGQTAGKIETAIKAAGKKNIIVRTLDSLTAAVDSAHELAAPGDVVLLSPACASYDMFKNFQQRGRIFQQLVKKLEKPTPIKNTAHQTQSQNR